MALARNAKKLTERLSHVAGGRELGTVNFYAVLASWFRSEQKINILLPISIALNRLTENPKPKLFVVFFRPFLQLFTKLL